MPSTDSHFYEVQASAMENEAIANKIKAYVEVDNYRPVIKLGGVETNLCNGSNSVISVRVAGFRH